MPDTSFSWRGLREHIRKYLWIYLAGVVLCLFGTHLLWTMTRPQLSNAESVSIYLADSYSNPDPLSDIAADALAKAQPFDETLKEVRFESMMFNDDYTSSMVLVTRLAVGECDAFLASRTAAEALAHSEALLPLDDYVAGGWLGDFGLEPYYATLENEETGERTTYLAGLKLDKLTALMELGAFNNQDAVLCVTANGGNQETTMKALEYVISDLTEASHAGTEAD